MLELLYICVTMILFGFPRNSLSKQHRASPHRAHLAPQDTRGESKQDKRWVGRGTQNGEFKVNTTIKCFVCGINLLHFLIQQKLDKKCYI